MEVASRLLAVAAPTVEPSRSVRSTGEFPRFVDVGARRRRRQDRGGDPRRAEQDRRGRGDRARRRCTRPSSRRSPTSARSSDLGRRPRRARRRPRPHQRQGPGVRPRRSSSSPRGWCTPTGPGCACSTSRSRARPRPSPSCTPKRSPRASPPAATRSSHRRVARLSCAMRWKRAQLLRGFQAGFQAVVARASSGRTMSTSLRPRRVPNFTTPFALANSVSSLPSPTL